MTTMATHNPPVTTAQPTVEPVFKPLGYQQRLIADDSRFILMNWSRQTGKSTAVALLAVDDCVSHAGTLWVLLSAGERQSRELMRKVEAFCRLYRVAAEAVDQTWFEGTTVRALEIALPNGSRIVGLPANPQTARGFSGNVFLDEFAMHRDDRGIWASLLPTVTRGYRLIVSSTPMGTGNVFWKLWTDTTGTWSRHKTTIYDAVADGLAVDPEELRTAIGDEDAWRQEYLCEAVDEATAFLPYELIGSCESDAASLTMPANWTPTGDVYIGWDVARWHDLSVIWTAERLADVLVTRDVCVMRRRPFAEQYAEFELRMAVPNRRRAAIDATGMGEAIAERAIAQYGSYAIDAVKFTAGVKATLAGQLRQQLEDRRARLPIDTAVRNDLHSVRRTMTAAGNVRFEGEGDGSHADRFWAAALMVEAATVTGGSCGVAVSSRD